jgi:hypothetical protein
VAGPDQRLPARRAALAAAFAGFSRRDGVPCEPEVEDDGELFGFGRLLYARAPAGLRSVEIGESLFAPVRASVRDGCELVIHTPLDWIDHEALWRIYVAWTAGGAQDRVVDEVLADLNWRRWGVGASGCFWRAR